MAKRESIWKANDGTEHRSKQSAAVADAEHDVRAFVEANADVDGGTGNGMSEDAILRNAEGLALLLANVIKARAALAKHEAKGE